MTEWIFEENGVGSQGSIQQWTAPYDGDFRITALGAQGGGNYGGKGASISGLFSLAEGEVIQALVGQRGVALLAARTDISGGGGTYVVDAENSPLVIAGGGGADVNSNDSKRHATIAEAGQSASSSGGSGGSGGGEANITVDGGAGYSGNGGSGNPGPAPQAFLNGGEGGHNTFTANGADGGYGGGGGASRGSSQYQAYGGGGGYSGGGGGYGGSASGGGGSINFGAAQENFGGDALEGNAGAGQVIIRLEGDPPSNSKSKVSGVVQIDGTPKQRIIRAFSYRSVLQDIGGTELLLSKSLGQSTSDPETGEYTIDLLAGYGQEIFVVAFDDYGDAFIAEQTLAAGDRIHPTTPNGHVWETTGAGTLPVEEPTWIVDTETSQLYGTASMIARTFYRPMVQGPIAPEVTSAPVAAWSPADLFQNSEVGIWLDPSDLTTLFQDSAATIPVVADGAPVGAVLDKSGNGNHAFAGPNHRPTYKTDGTLHWLEFDKASGQYLKAPQVIYGTLDRCIFYVTEPFSLGYSSSPKVAFDLTESAATGLGRDFSATHEADGVYLRVDGRTHWPATLDVDVTYRFVMEWDHTNGAIDSDDTVLRINGTIEPIGNGTPRTIDTYQTTNMLIGYSNRQSDAYFDGKMFEFVALQGTTTEQQKQDMEDYLIAKLAG
jgi:hypothetical protein